MAQLRHIVHTIPPTFDANSRVLVLGSMPSPRSRETGFNYGHPRNRFWQVMARLADEPVPATNERKRDFCLRHHIALWDVLAECDIEGASDTSIRNPIPNDLAHITRAAPIEAVFCTGAKSHELYLRLCAGKVGMPAAKLPSTSPANAAWSLDMLVEAYAPIFSHEHAFGPPVLDVPEVVALEQAIAQAGTPLSELMDRAGTALAYRVRGILHEAGGPHGASSAGAAAGADATAPEGAGFRGLAAASRAPLVAILCGNGNNGGDGWVAARVLVREGVRVAVLTTREPEDITAQPAHDAAVAARGVLEEHGARMVAASDLPSRGLSAPDSAPPADAGPLIVVDDSSDAAADAVSQLIGRADVVVDAILGTGAAFAPRAPFANWVEAANRTRAGHATVAADVPSGVDARTGAVYEPHVVADETVTMIVPKPGLAAPACGRVQVAPLAYIEPILAARGA